MVENLGFAGFSRGNQVLVENLENVFADLAELLLDGDTVIFDELDLGLIAFGLFLLLDGCHNSPTGTASTDDVLVGNREEVSFLHRKFLVCRSNNLHVLNHFCVYWLAHNLVAGVAALFTFIPLSLLGKLCQVDRLFDTHFVFRFWLGNGKEGNLVDEWLARGPSNLTNNRDVGVVLRAATHFRSSQSVNIIRD